MICSPFRTAVQRFTYAFLILVVVCSLAFSCVAAPPTPLQPATQEQRWPTLAPSPPPAPPVAPSGTLNLYGSDPLTLDPAISSDGTSHSYILQIFSGLACLNDKMMPAADIAQSCQVSNGGKTYTFHLRRDVRFHDGREVTAADFKYSWERACNPDTKSITAQDFLGDIIGVKEVLAGQTKEISGVKVIDEYTLEVTIDAPKAYFLSKLTYPTSFVVDRRTVLSGKEWWRQPNGTGPFRVKEWEKSKSLILDRNAAYYGEQAKVESVNFHLLTGVVIDQYEKGDIDAMQLSLANLGRATDKTGSLYKELSIVPALSFEYIGFNMTKPPFDDINMRLAFSHAIDKDRLVALVFQGMAQRADGILPPGIPGYNKNLRGIEFNVSKAKELIARSKYANRVPPLTMTYSGWGGQISSLVAAVIYEWRQNLGIEVNVRQLDPPRFAYHLKEEKDLLFANNWKADYPHPQNFLDILFRTGNVRNYSEYSNSEIDALLDKAAREQNDNLGLALYQEIEQKLVNDAACLPLRVRQNYMLVKPHIKGYELNVLNLVKLNRVSIEPQFKWGN